MANLRAGLGRLAEAHRAMTARRRMPCRLCREPITAYTSRKHGGVCGQCSPGPRVLEGAERVAIDDYMHVNARRRVRYGRTRPESR